MTRDQKIVAIGALSGVVTMAAGMWVFVHLLPEPAATAAIADRIAYALRWNVLAALPLVALIGTIGNSRFFTDAIDPLRGAEDRALDINRRVALNTLEQTVIFAIATMALSTMLSPGQLTVIGAAAICFVVARLAFWIGYRIDPLYRAAGFAASAYLAVGLLVWAGWLAVAG